MDPNRYVLAVDVGTSRTGAAIARAGTDGRVDASAFRLGRNGDHAPTVLFVGDGEVLVGDAAERRGVAHPERLIREFKRRLGDPAPFVAGGRLLAAEDLYARVVSWVTDQVTEREGRPPSAIAVTVPAAWGPHRRELIDGAIRRDGGPEVMILTEPEAAALHYDAIHPVAAGSALAIYDFGGGTFDAVVLRKDDAGVVTMAGEPVGLEHLGGSDFDDAMLRHVVAAAQLDPREFTDADEATRMALATLRQECVAAKEALSFDTEAAIPVLVGARQGSIRIVRDEFEALIADDVALTFDAFDTAIDRAGVAVDDLTAILLTGGSSRIPLIAQLLSERYDSPLAIDTDPKAVIALGAALHAATQVLAPPVVETATDDDDATIAMAIAEPVPADAVAAARRTRRRRIAILIGGGVATAASVALLSNFAAGPTLTKGIAPVADSIAMESGTLETTADPNATADAAQMPPPGAPPSAAAPNVVAPAAVGPVANVPAPAPKASSTAPTATHPAPGPTSTAPDPRPTRTHEPEPEPEPSNTPTTPTPTPTPEPPPPPPPPPPPEDPPATTPALASTTPDSAGPSAEDQAAVAA